MDFSGIGFAFNRKTGGERKSLNLGKKRGCLKSSYETKSKNQALPLIRQLPEGLIFSNFTRHLPGKGQKVAENLVLFLFRHPLSRIILWIIYPK